MNYLYTYRRARRGWAGLLGIGLGVGLAALSFGRTLTPDPKYADICERLAQRLPRLHLLHLDMGDMVSGRAWTNLLVSFDYEKLYFLQSDIDRFRAHEYALDDDLKRGDMAFAFQVFDVFQQRVSNRVDYVDQLLRQGFNWTQDETYVWQRRDAAWPADAAEWDNLWRKKIKNEYLRLLLAREMEAQAATNAALTNAAATNRASAQAATASAPGVTVLPSGVTVTPGDVAHDAGVVTIAGAAGETQATGTVSRAPEPIEKVIGDRYHQADTIVDDSDAEFVLQHYLNAFAEAYDPHSEYYTPSALEDFEIEMNLSLCGIGALLSAEDGAAKIVRLIPGGPAARDTRDKRLQTGDKIVAVAQDENPPVDILHWPLHKIVDLIRGEKGTRVVLTVIPNADSSGSVTKKVDLIRDEVKLEDQAASGTTRTIKGRDKQKHTLGIIRLPAFYGSMQTRSPNEPGFRSAVYDVVQVLSSLRTQSVEGVVLDLRNNGGGALVEAIDMTGLFIRRGPTVQVKERSGTRALDDEDPRIFYNGPLVVLVNRLSASASEILAGALQDYGRAVIVGDSKTHGKGTVQSVLDLGRDKSLGALKITTQSFIRITGASTQLQGIKPDIVVPSPWDFMETGEEFLPNPMPWSLEPATPFRRYADLSEIIPALRERSEQRRRNDPSFQTYARFLTRIAEMNASKELPLNLDVRRKLAKTERDLSDLQERMAVDEGDGATDANASKAPDLVLNECLQILLDLVKQQAATDDEPNKDDPPTRSVADWTSY